MATLNCILTFTGRLGNIIAYRRGGKYCLRTRPETVRQTDATRHAAKCFGAASRKGALIRSAFTANLDIHCEGSLVNRLNSAILRAGRNNHAGLTGFRFNPYTGIEKLLPQQPVFSKDGKLHIPAQRLQPPGGATRLEVKLIASRIDFTNRRVTGSDTTVLNIDLGQPFEGADMPVDVPGKGTLVLALQVRMYRRGDVTYNRKYTAADILAVVREQTAAKKVRGEKFAASRDATPLRYAGYRNKLFHPQPVQPVKPTAAAGAQTLVQRE